MIASFMSVLLLSVQGGAIAIPTPQPEIEQKEVAYEALSEGRTDQAIAALQSQLKADPADPATLINLGSAYAQRGDRTSAAQAYKAALASDTRYRMELADGTWADSRQLARLALRRLDQPQTASLD